MLALLLATAFAAPGGVQVRAFPGAVDFAETYAEDLDPTFAYDDLSAPYQGCYDLVGVLDFNLSVPIDDVDLALDDDQLTVTIDFGTIEGTGMTLYGVDSDWLDACPEFTTELYYARVLDARVVAALELDTGFGGFFGDPTLTFAWVEPPIVEGTIETDIAWVPDGAVMYFLEDAIKQAAVDALTDTLPPLLADFLGESSYGGEYGGLATDLSLADAAITPESMTVSVDVGLAATGTATCEIGNAPQAPAPTGLRSPELPLAEPVGSDLGVGLTEALLGEGLHAAWEAGWFCAETGSIDQLVGALALFVDPDVANLEGWATLDQPPQLVATASGIEVVVPDIRMELTGRVDGDTVPIVVTRFDLRGTAIPGFDQDLSAMTLSLVKPRFDFHEVRLNHVKTPQLAQPAIEAEIEAWASDQTRSSMRNVVLFDALYYAWDIAMKLDYSQPVDGGLELYFSLYDVDDPAVDRVAPEATITRSDVSGRTIRLDGTATDDRAEPLAYAWQINGAGWTDWSNDASLTLSDLPDGDYTIELSARDTWLNADATPDTVTVTVRGSKAAQTGCGCANTSGSASFGLLALASLALRRRR